MHDINVTTHSVIGLKGKINGKRLLNGTHVLTTAV